MSDDFGRKLQNLIASEGGYLSLEVESSEIYLHKTEGGRYQIQIYSPEQRTEPFLVLDITEIRYRPQRLASLWRSTEQAPASDNGRRRLTESIIAAARGAIDETEERKVSEQIQSAASPGSKDSDAIGIGETVEHFPQYRRDQRQHVIEIGAVGNAGDFRRGNSVKG